MNCKDSEKPGAESGWSLPCIPLSLPPHGRKNLSPLRERASEGGEKTIHGRSSKKPTVGRQCDLQWVGKTTYSRFILEAL